MQMSNLEAFAVANGIKIPAGMGEREMHAFTMNEICRREDVRRANEPAPASCPVRSSQRGSCGM